MSKKNHVTIHALGRNIATVIGLVLIWRGFWYIMDQIDIWVFSGSHVLTALGGIILGLAILYLPDRNLDEIERL